MCLPCLWPCNGLATCPGRTIIAVDGHRWPCMKKWGRINWWMFRVANRALQWTFSQLQQLGILTVSAAYLIFLSLGSLQPEVPSWFYVVWPLFVSCLCLHIFILYYFIAPSISNNKTLKPQWQPTAHNSFFVKNMRDITNNRGTEFCWELFFSVCWKSQIQQFHENCLTPRITTTSEIRLIWWIFSVETLMTQRRLGN